MPGMALCPQIDRFKQEKFQDFRQFLLDFVNLQVVYNKKVRVSCFYVDCLYPAVHALVLLLPD